MYRLGNFGIQAHQGYDADEVLGYHETGLVEIWVYNDQKN